MTLASYGSRSPVSSSERFRRFSIPAPASFMEDPSWDASFAPFLRSTRR